jgi:hypothetical protein
MRATIECCVTGFGERRVHSETRDEIAAQSLLTKTFLARFNEAEQVNGQTFVVHDLQIRREAGSDRRTIERAAARGEELGHDLDAVAGTSLDEGVELDALAKPLKEERCFYPCMGALHRN